jgi:hypothetical protein
MRSIDPCPKCGGTKPHKGRKPDCGFAEPEPPEQGGEQLPFVETVGFIFSLQNTLRIWSKIAQKYSNLHDFYLFFYTGLLIRQPRYMPLHYTIIFINMLPRQYK